MFDLSGRTAIVTGGSRGIGRAISTALAAAGARVLINYRSNLEAAEAAAAEIARNGGACAIAQGDAARPDDARGLVEQAIERFGRLDILVNNAGVTRDDLLVRMSEEQWDEVMSLNLRGAFLCTKAALRPMIRQRWGRIITVGSVAGIMGNAGQANYAAAKAGLIGFTKAVAKEVASRNITANVVAPGFVDTEMTRDLSDSQKQQILAMVPLGRAATPADVAPAVVFLASEEAGYITGHVLTVDGGLVMY